MRLKKIPNQFFLGKLIFGNEIAFSLMKIYFIKENNKSCEQLKSLTGFMLCLLIPVNKKRLFLNFELSAYLVAVNCKRA